MNPVDVHDQALLDAVRPAQWRNPEPASRYNLVVLGAGTGGLVAAAVAAGLGAKVALVERDRLGGDCLNTGCVPSKALIRAGRLASEAQSAAALARPPGDAPRPDFGAAMERMRAVRASIAPHDSAQRFRDDVGVDVFRGEGRFVAPRHARSRTARRLRFRRAILATGARASAPPIPGLAEAGFLTNETVFSLTASPGRLAIVGGGPIGCELAQAFARLGVAVTIFEMGAHLLEREDADAAAIVQSALLRDGVKLVLGCKLRSVTREAGGEDHPLRGGGRRRLRRGRRDPRRRGSRAERRGPRDSRRRASSTRPGAASRSTIACAPRIRASSRSAIAAWPGSSPTPPTPPRRSPCRTRSSSAARSSRRW